MVDLLSETVDTIDDWVTDKYGQQTNVEEDDVSCDCGCCSTCCPQAEDVTQNIATLNLADGDAEVVVENQTGIVGTVATLSNTPISGYDVKCFKNGLLQRETTDYTISGATVTWVTPLVASDQCAY